MSEQDFFFEDESEVEVKSAPKPKKGSKAAAAKRAPVRKAANAPSGEFQFSVIVVVLIAIIALLLGFLLGILVGKSLTPPVMAPVEGGGGASPMGGGQAPQLNDEQMQQGMPAGHPDVGTMGSGEETATK
jgi:hypothetical protein